MSKKSCQQKPPRIPAKFKGIQVNCCKFTRCENFGLTPGKARETELFQEYNKNKINRQVRESDPYYAITGNTIKCKSCEQIKALSGNNNQVYYSLKSNIAVHEEYERISSYLIKPGTVCTNPECPSHETEEYKIKKNGYTAKGVPRFKCKVCGKSPTGRPIDRVHEKSEINKAFFKSLVSKSPFRAMEFRFDLSMGAIYRRINFLHRQCMAFVAERERRLFESKSHERLYLCTDRIVQKSNWTNRKSKKNCEFYGIATAELTTDYVLAFNFNYDPDIDPHEVEEQAQEIKDSEKLKHNRKFARLWLNVDFEQSKIDRANKKKRLSGSQLEYISNKTQDMLEDEEQSSELFDKFTALPSQGMEVHNEYTMAAHFFLIKKLTQNAQMTRFYLDLDAGMKTWLLAAFKEEILEGKCDGFLVNMDKELTVDVKRQEFQKAKDAIEKYSNSPYESLNRKQRTTIINQMIIDDIASPYQPEGTVDSWIKNPTPFMGEPNKMISAFTNIERFDLNHQANLYRKGSLHAVDRFFQKLRRRVSIFERPFQSGSNRHRIWNGYSPYNPAMYQKLADIYRVFYNYCDVSKKYKVTPAMRLGLSKGPVELEKIIYFEKYKKG
ncbi:hypothetical protein [Pseudoalteromonas sp. MMG012]|uniref:IS1/IS1595 family N-terminal zinc-binding domain-containing protein n=1 Tax=Pseudoalteromonas sp. MMG012 TaxID=2822686 RepID=UPI001B3A02D6|nr:hypothetical protein [Pseudoalteromonas sp. MMG012]MBQ4850755.1 hypothetical protein [Pseudoalteromonas sp. MMG012]